MTSRSCICSLGGGGGGGERGEKKNVERPCAYGRGSKDKMDCGYTSIFSGGERIRNQTVAIFEVFLKTQRGGGGGPCNEK